MVDILAVVADGELGPILDSLPVISASRDQVYEAILRNFYEPTSGGCRRIPDTNMLKFDCSYENMIDWLYTITSFFNTSWDVGGPQGQSVQVNLMNILGILSPGASNDQLSNRQAQRILESDRGTWPLAGFANWDGQTNDYNAANLISRRLYTGQGPDVPSSWGNMVIPTGRMTCPANPERFSTRITHHYVSGPVTYDQNVDTTRGPICSDFFAVVTTDGRFPGTNTCYDSQPTTYDC